MWMNYEWMNKQTDMAELWKDKERRIGMNYGWWMDD